MTRSQQLFEAAQQVMPGGVNSPVRACRSVGTYPRFLEKGLGSHVWDVDGKEYIDLICSWGPLILGHCQENVEQAVAEAIGKGLSFGAPTAVEVEMAQLVCRMTGVEMVRMVNSGTEAVMSALRLARGATGRSKIIKFAGCYHGHSDSMLVKAGSGALTGGSPDSVGVPAEIAGDTLTASYNDLESVEAIVVEETVTCERAKIQHGNGQMDRRCRRKYDEETRADSLQEGEPLPVVSNDYLS